MGSLLEAACAIHLTECAFFPGPSECPFPCCLPHFPGGQECPLIHKSQGSEYPAVVIPVMTQHYAMLQRNLLYTGVTRGKKLVVLVGQKKAVAIAVGNVSGRRRWSKLNEWLRPVLRGDSVTRG